MAGQTLRGQGPYPGTATTEAAETQPLERNFWPARQPGKLPECNLHPHRHGAGQYEARRCRSKYPLGRSAGFVGEKLGHGAEVLEGTAGKTAGVIQSPNLLWRNPCPLSTLSL